MPRLKFILFLLGEILPSLLHLNVVAVVGISVHVYEGFGLSFVYCDLLLRLLDSHFVAAIVVTFIGADIVAVRSLVLVKTHFFHLAFEPFYSRHLRVIISDS